MKNKVVNFTAKTQQICYKLAKNIGGIKMSPIKLEAKKLISRLPDSATWDDILYEFHVKRKIDIALDAVKSGKIISHEQAKKRLLSK